jgi:hypothetical protein
MINLIIIIFFSGVGYGIWIYTNSKSFSRLLKKQNGAISIEEASFTIKGKDKQNTILIFSGLYLAMLVGICSISLYKELSTHQSISKAVVVRIASGVIISPMVFRALISKREMQKINYRSFLLAYEHGFFWDAIIGEVAGGYNV